MNEKLNHLKSVSLSDKQIEKMSGAKCLLYDDLYKYTELETLLDHNNGKIILLYLSKDDPNYGHFTCILKTKYKDKNNKKDCVEFFDSYNLKPDTEFKFSSAKHGQDFKYLSLLMLDSPYLLTYNDHKFQKEKNAINTCGWHCACRLLNNDKTLIEYKQYLDTFIKECPEVKDYDDAVVVVLFDKYMRSNKEGGRYRF